MSGLLKFPCHSLMEFSYSSIMGLPPWYQIGAISPKGIFRCWSPNKAPPYGEIHWPPPCCTTRTGQYLFGLIVPSPEFAIWSNSTAVNSRTTRDNQAYFVCQITPDLSKQKRGIFCVVSSVSKLITFKTLSALRN